MDGGWKNPEEMAHGNLNSFKGTVRASWVALEVHRHISSSMCSSRIMTLPMKKWGFVSPSLEVGQAQFCLMKESKINTIVVLKPLQGKGRERWTHGADLSVTLNKHFKKQIYIDYVQT